MAATNVVPMTEAPAPSNLVEKLAAVMAQVERVPKSGHNAFHNYDYATEADITSAVRASLASHGVMLIPSVEKTEWRQVKTQKGEETIATLTVKFTATDGKDKIEFNVLGEGQDRGDKATYKAMTGAIKYALLKLFLIPTGDDPEREEDEKPAPRQQRQAPRPAAAPPPRAAPPNVAAAAAVLGATVIPPSTVAALWDKAGDVWEPDEREKKWRTATWAVFKGQPPKTSTWTEAQIREVEKFLFEPEDVSF